MLIGIDLCIYIVATNAGELQEEECAKFSSLSGIIVQMSYETG